MVNLLKKAIQASLVILATAFIAFAEEPPQGQPIGPFSGLYTNVAQEAIPSTNSPDLLNVDITPGGKSVKKREGYGRDVTLTISTSAVHNLYKFFDSSGNEVRLAFNDVKVSASVNGAAWAVILTTGITTGASWDCTDYLGFAYCDSNAFDPPFKTNGTTAGTSTLAGTNGAPSGTLIASTADRLLIGGTSANPSRIYYSVSASFSDFTLGTANSSSSFEDINAPGSKLTHLAYRYGRWLWWKDQSFGFLVGTGQLDLQIFTVSNTIGTFDNTDVYDHGITYFRGSDAQIYAYDGNVLTRISTDISPTVKSANRRKANSWAQTSQSDFQSGSISTNGPSSGLSTTISAGQVTQSSITITDTSSADFQLGSGSYVDTTTVSGAVTLKTYENEDCSSLSEWTNESLSCTGGNWSVSGGKCTASTIAQMKLTTDPNPTGNFSLSFVNQGGTSQVLFEALSSTGTNNFGYVFGVGSSVIQILAVNNFSGWFCSTASGLIASTAAVISPVNGDTFLFRRDNTTGVMNGYQNGVLKCSLTDTTYTSFGPVKATNGNGGSFDNFVISASTGNFISREFDTAFSSPIYGTFTINTAGTGTTSTSVRTSASSGSGYGADSTITSGSKITNGTLKRYLIYSSTMIATSLTDASVLPQITDVAVIAASTGTFYSAVNNASLLSAWNEFAVGDTTNGSASITYYTRASTNSFTILSSTPTWVAQAKNSTVAASTGTYFQARADFSMSVASDTAFLSDFQFNWFEGSAADRMYGTYFDNAIWFSVSLGTSSTTNNRILKYDLLNATWLLYDIKANGFLTYGNNLYFASPLDGNVFEYGQGVVSDSGTAINSYWKSKAFFGDSPFSDKDLRMASWYIAKSSGTTLTMTYTMDESTTVTKTINLYNSSKNLIQSNWNFPLGSIGTNFNVQFGDNSSNPRWEVFGGLITFVPKPWKITP